ncbi:Acyltransferase family protein [Roseimaritima multifibrata]|uniref:Acyltransferase family protein n=1 Tax=Roseimaritima multifibrata TaxID=1930274 RepID=A0A517MN64_9BACT|nr:acyltransferase family protein [Roseimaritima multifibrata]QDS96321.1 Acyltransferase family protein [Roseimaritima multifibrata]
MGSNQIASRLALMSQFGQRNRALDTLRGFAILLMVVDHVAGILMHVSIDYSTVRFWTRLSMPLFCVLMGYFLPAAFEDRSFTGRVMTLLPRKRFIQLVLATIVINVAFYAWYQELEILASLTLAYVVAVVTGRYFVALVLALFFYSVDPTAAWLDYPLSVVVPFVAQGMILERYGTLAALVSGCLLASGVAWLGMGQSGGVSYMLCYFILPATGMVAWAAKRPKWHVAGLETIGQYPLTCYLVQYYLIFAIAAAMR